VASNICQALIHDCLFEASLPDNVDAYGLMIPTWDKAALERTRDTRQGLTLVHFSAQSKHNWWDASGGCRVKLIIELRSG
jgi:hypothetical protein